MGSFINLTFANSNFPRIWKQSRMETLDTFHEQNNYFFLSLEDTFMAIARHIVLK